MLQCIGHPIYTLKYVRNITLVATKDARDIKEFVVLTWMRDKRELA